MTCKQAHMCLRAHNNVSNITLKGEGKRNDDVIPVSALKLDNMSHVQQLSVEIGSWITSVRSWSFHVFLPEDFEGPVSFSQRICFFPRRTAYMNKGSGLVHIYILCTYVHGPFSEYPIYHLEFGSSNIFRELI